MSDLARWRALCKLLVEDGHMTPVAERQILKLAGLEDDPPASIYTCPRCFRVSDNPSDVKYGYCGACHAVTRDYLDG